MMNFLNDELKEPLVIDEFPDEYDNWGMKSLNLFKTWEHTKGEGVKIAMIDSGVEMNHPDLMHSIAKTANAFNKSTSLVSDKYGHGTTVAGLMTGLRTGIAPESSLYVMSVLNDSGMGRMSDVLDGITFAINFDVDILCVSLGTNKPLPGMMVERLEKAHHKGISIVCAVGNNSQNSVRYPAKYDFIIGVGGSNKEGWRATFSNYGNGLDILAPAVDMLTTYKDGKYAIVNGTSYSAPTVAGAIALIKSYHRKNGTELSPSEIKSLITKNGEHLDVDSILGFKDS